MFSGSIVRKLAQSEESFAQYQLFTALTVQLRGVVDVDAVEDAFDALVEAHPVFASHLERGPDGGFYIVADDVLHAGIWVVDDRNGFQSGNADVKLDQGVSLINLRLILREGGAELTLYTHHALADGHHLATLLDELFTRYTNVVTTGDPGPIVPAPAPASMEVMLEQRGVKRLALSGAERFMSAVFAYDLPPEEPSIIVNPGPPQSVPVTRVRLNKQETADLVEFSRDNHVSLNAVVAAAILLTEWRIRGTPHIPIPYLYPVDLRYLLNPPVGATETTNLCGIAAYLAEIGPDTDIVDLASDMMESLRADLADGVIQQSAFHLGTGLESRPPGLPTIVFCTDVSSLPIPELAGIELQHFESQFYWSFDEPREYAGCFYGCGVHAGELLVQQHTLLPVEKNLEEIRSLLCSVPSEYGWVME